MAVAFIPFKVMAILPQAGKENLTMAGWGALSGGGRAARSCLTGRLFQMRKAGNLSAFLARQLRFLHCGEKRQDPIREGNKVDCSRTGGVTATQFCKRIRYLSSYWPLRDAQTDRDSVPERVLHDSSMTEAVTGYYV